MVKFVELENGDFFNASQIMELRANVRADINSATRCKVIARIDILATDGGTMRTLISGIGEAPWMDSEDVELYEIVREALETAENETREFFSEIARMMASDELLFYFLPLSKQQKLQQIAKRAAEKIVYAAHKGETEDE